MGKTKENNYNCNTVQMTFKGEDSAKNTRLFRQSKIRNNGRFNIAEKLITLATMGRFTKGG